MRYSINPMACREFGCRRVDTEARTGLGRRGVATGGNSGYQAVNLAYLLGASRVVLIGFDMQGAGPGRNHFHPDHNAGGRHNLTNPTESLYRQWRRRFSEIHEALAEEGVALVNASRETALTIPRVDLEDEICLSI